MEKVTPMFIEVIVLGEKGLEIRKVPNTNNNQPRVITTEEFVSLVQNNTIKEEN